MEAGVFQARQEVFGVGVGQEGERVPQGQPAEVGEDLARRRCFDGMRRFPHITREMSGRLPRISGLPACLAGGVAAASHIAPQMRGRMWLE